MDPKTILLDLFETAVAVAQPAKRLPALLPPVPKGRTVVIGAGKAAAEMAAQLEQVWPGPLSGVVVTRYGHAVPCRSVKVLEASHPFPDHNSMAAAQALHDAVGGLSADDLVISLISGGGSALLTWPVDGVTLADKQALTRALFAAGATIRELNTVRRQLSRIKGGRLAAAAWPAQVVTLLISDVPGDDPALIASGPTVPPPQDSESAAAIVERLGVDVPPNVAEALRRPAPSFPHGFDHCRSAFIATPMQSLQAAAERARALGLNTIVLSDQIEGEAREVAQVHAGIAKSVLRYDTPLQRPALILSGGETTVSFGDAEGGRGGRNSEFLLALGHALRGEANVWALACDTDGRDGSEDNAGALWCADSMARAGKLGLAPEHFLVAHDSYTFFHRLDDLVVTGPTQTNVNDFRAVYLPAP
jgi:hydroxypyruvate reductase